MSHDLTQSSAWADALPLLQCTHCGSDLEAQSEHAFCCRGCGQTFPMREGFLDAMGDLAGNNRVAADYYDGPLWPKFRFWERLTFFLHGGTRRARGKVIRHLPDLSGTRLLEVAIGDGSNLPLIPPDCDGYAIDISVVQMRDCRRKYPERRVHLVLGEAEALPFCDNTFDNVFSFGAFNYFSDPLKSLREMARVVKPEGLIVVSDEYPSLPNRMLFRKIGLLQVDRWIMSRLLHLGNEFTELVEKHRDLKLEPIFSQVLEDYQIESLWCKLAYCVVGRPKRSEKLAQPAAVAQA